MATNFDCDFKQIRSRLGFSEAEVIFHSVEHQIISGRPFSNNDEPVGLSDDEELKE